MLHLYVYPVKLKGMTHLSISTRPSPGMFNHEKEVGALRLQPQHADDLIEVLKKVDARDYHVEIHVQETDPAR
jgi:hypothetical protein